MRFVVDASVAVEYLLRTSLGRRAAEMLDGSALFAPELLDAEVLAVLRRLVLSRRLIAARAAEALEDLIAWDVTRLSHRELVARAWVHRHNVSAYDALYVSAAEARDAVVLTADGPLARAPGLPVVVQTLRGAP